MDHTAAGLKLGHLVFSVRKPQAWARFCETMLGLPPPLVNSDGSRGYQIDGAGQRIIVTEGRSDDLAALGLECRDDATLDTLIERIAAAGITAEPAHAVLRHGRRVRRLVRLADPAGNMVELFVEPEPAAQPFRSAAFPRGFVTGDLGLGHAVLVSRRLEAMERFYVDVLGFGVTERLATRLGPIELNGVFLHCNRRHHSLALFDLPLRKRLHHFMLQAQAFADVGAAFERAQREVPLSLDLGQHPDPDGTFSFYGATPSGFDFEIGAGSNEIEPGAWREQRMDGKSPWGHKPRLRQQLKLAVELLASKVTL
jgi:2,3-dihydroxybiphenyl 1,2-dioxygenase